MQNHRAHFLTILFASIGSFLATASPAPAQSVTAQPGPQGLQPATPVPVPCKDCPPPVIFPNSSTGMPKNLVFHGPGNGPDVPFVLPPPPAAPGGGDPPSDVCAGYLCWELREVWDGKHWTDSWVEVLHLGGCTSGGNSQICPDPEQCFEVSLPCADVDNDGLCAWVDPDEDPHDTVGDDWWFGDTDGDKIPNILDTHLPDGTPNPYLPLPNDARTIDEILDQFGLPHSEHFQDLDNDYYNASGGHHFDFDLNGDGKVTYGEAIAAIPACQQATLAATIASFDPVTSNAQTTQAFLQQLKDLTARYKGSNAAYHDMLANMGPDFFGGTAAKGKALAAVTRWGNQLSNFLADISSHLAHLNHLIQVQTQLAKVKIEQALSGQPGSDLVDRGDGDQVRDTGSGTPKTPGQGESQAGDPVNTQTGEFDYHCADLFLPGHKGMDIAIERYYSSRSSGTKGLVGTNWTMPLVDTKLLIYEDPNGRILDIVWGDGRHSYFQRDPSSGLYLGIKGEFGKIRAFTPQTANDQTCDDDSKGMIYRAPSGKLYYFCRPSIYLGLPNVFVGWLRKVSDPDGNSIHITRDLWGHPESIENSAGNSLRLIFDKENHLLTKIVDRDGRRWDYSYDRSEADGLRIASAGGQQTSASSWDLAIATSATPGVAVPATPAPIPPKKISGDLLEVLYPATLHLSDVDRVAQARPSERYAYWQAPQGFAAAPGSRLNHNLKTAERSGGGAQILIEYYTDNSQADSFDRVKAYTVDGKTTRFAYSNQPGSGNAYGQNPARSTLVRFPGGEVESYFHDAAGRLLRHEVAAGFDANGDFLPEGIDPNGPIAWVTLYGYASGNDFLLESEIRTTPAGFAQTRRRATYYAYDSVNPDRFQQANLLEKSEYPDPYDQPNWALSYLYSAMSYDPITAQPRTIEDATGRVIQKLYTHQELDAATVSALPQIAGWGLVLNAADFGKGDLNGDLVLGGTFQVAQIKHPSGLIASPDNPTAAKTLFAPVELRQYNSRGQLTGLRDGAGIWTTTEYTRGWPSRTVTDPTGLALVESRSYDRAGRLLTQTLPDGSGLRFVYDARDLTIEQRQTPRPGAGFDGTEIVEQFFFDLAGRVAGSSPPSYASSGAISYGVGFQPFLTSRIRYLSSGLPARVEKRVLGSTGSLQTGTVLAEFDGKGQIAKMTSPSGAQIALSRDPRGLVLRADRKSADGLGFSTNSYNNYGDQAQRVVSEDSDGDGAPDTTQYFHDGYGRRYKTVSPAGIARSIRIDEFGRVYQEDVVGSNGVQIFKRRWDYDNLDRPNFSEIDNLRLNADGSVAALNPPKIRTNYGYGKRQEELLWTFVDPQGEQALRRFRYDSLGRKTGEIEGFAGELAESTLLDSLGRVVERRTQHDLRGATGAVNPSESVWRFDYDGFGRLSTRHHPDGAVSRFEFDASGRIQKAIDPLGSQTLSAYDSEGNAEKTTEIGWDGLTRTVTREFDLLGELLRLTDGKGQTTRYSYDAFSRLVSRLLPDGKQEERYFYDSLDRRVRTEKPGGIAVYQQYDGESRLVSRIATPDALGASKRVMQSWKYDGLGRLIEANDLVGSNPANTVTIRRAHSSLGLQLEEQFLALGLPAKSISMQYDAKGFLESVVYPSGLAVSREADEIGRLRKITASTGGVLAQFGQLYGSQGFLAADLASGGKLLQEYDAAGRTLRQEFQKQNGSTIQGRRYGFDAADNLRQRFRLQGTALKNPETLVCDGLHRLTSWQFQGADTGDANRSMSWGWDLADNASTIQDSLLGATAPGSGNALNQYTSFLPHFSSIQYNVRGEEIHRGLGPDGIDWVWDSLGRPVQASVHKNGATATIQYLHDALGRLVLQATSGAVAETVQYSYFDSTLLASDSSVHGAREIVTGKRGEAFGRIRQQSGERMYFFTDPFGNVEGLNDGANLLESYAYSPFGKLWNPQNPVSPVSGSALGNDLFFLAQPHDFTSGLSRLGARLFDPLLERFVNRDPLGEAGSLNLYGYAKQNPFRWQDASGLTPGEHPNRPNPGGSGMFADRFRAPEVVFHRTLFDAFRYFLGDSLGMEWNKLSLEELKSALGAFKSDLEDLLDEVDSAFGRWKIDAGTYDKYRAGIQNSLNGLDNLAAGLSSIRIEMDAVKFNPPPQKPPESWFILDSTDPEIGVGVKLGPVGANAGLKWTGPLTFAGSGIDPDHYLDGTHGDFVFKYGAGIKGGLGMKLGAGGEYGLLTGDTGSGVNVGYSKRLGPSTDGAEIGANLVVAGGSVGWDIGSGVVYAKITTVIGGFRIGFDMY